MHTNAQSNLKSYLSFQIGNEVFGTVVDNVTNILEMVKITRVPKSPRYLKGVINLRGSILPVIDTRIKFGIQESEFTNNTCILVLEMMNKNEVIRLGAIVDSVHEVIDIDETEIMPPPSIGTTYKADAVKGITNKDGKLIMIIDVAKVFIDEEIKIVQGQRAEMKAV